MLQKKLCLTTSQSEKSGTLQNQTLMSDLDIKIIYYSPVTNIGRHLVSEFYSVSSKWNRKYLRQVCTAGEAASVGDTSRVWPTANDPKGDRDIQSTGR